MQIVVNGSTVDLEDGATLFNLLEHLGLSDAKIAVELNQNIVPRSQLAEQNLQHQDQVEIVHAIGGG
jgi:sulfur carrier protein